jgi:hypothetical protein
MKLIARTKPYVAAGDFCDQVIQTARSRVATKARWNRRTLKPPPFPIEWVELRGTYLYSLPILTFQFALG